MNLKTFISLTLVFVVVSFSSSSIFIFAQQSSSGNNNNNAGAGGTCSGTEAYWIPDGRDYRGTVSTTRSGLVCQPWTSQSPHQHATQMDQSVGIAAHNHCRNPPGSPMASPWCYTMSNDILYEVCNVGPPCTEGSGSAVTHPVTFSPTSGSDIASPGEISLSCDTFNSTIYYTVDSTVPSKTTATIYKHPITIVGSGYLIVQAFAERPGFLPSDIKTATFQLEPPSLPSVVVTPLPSRVGDLSKPVLVSLSFPSSTTSSSGSNNIGLEIRYRIVPVSSSSSSSNKDDETTLHLTLQNSEKYTQPFWVRSASKVLTASFSMVQTSTIDTLNNNNNNNNKEQKSEEQKSSTISYFYNLNIPKSPTPVIAPSGPVVSGFGRVVFVLGASNVEIPTFIVCVNKTSSSSTSSSSSGSSGYCSEVKMPNNAFSLTTQGQSKVSFSVYGSNTAPSDTVEYTALVLPMPRVRLSVPTDSVFVGPVDVSASCETHYKFLVNGKERQPPLVLSEVGVYIIETYSVTVWDKGPTTKSKVTLQAANLPKPLLDPLPGIDVPSTEFTFGSPLVVTLKSLPYLTGSFFKLEVFLLGDQQQQNNNNNNNKISELSADKLATNKTHQITLSTNNGNAKIYKVIVTTICDVNAKNCKLIDQSVVTEAKYHVGSSTLSSKITQRMTSPTFMLTQVSETMGISTVTLNNNLYRAAVLSALFSKKQTTETETSTTTTTTNKNFDVNIKKSDNKVFLSLTNLSPKQLIEYTSWFVSDLSFNAQTARSASLRLRLGMESSHKAVSVDTTTKFVGCISSTALSNSLGTKRGVSTVADCTTFCFNAFPELARRSSFSSSSSEENTNNNNNNNNNGVDGVGSIIAVLSPQSRCDCIDPSFPVSTDNFAPSVDLCNNPCTTTDSSSNSNSNSNEQQNTCGGTVSNPASYGLWSGTVCSAYFALSPLSVELFPVASSWQLVGQSNTLSEEEANAITVSDNNGNNNNNNGVDPLLRYTATTTSVLSMKISIQNSLSLLTSSNDEFTVGRVVLIPSNRDCSSDAAEAVVNNRLLGYTARFGRSGVTEGMVVPTVGLYRVCVSFPAAYEDNNTYREVSFVGDYNSQNNQQNNNNKHPQLLRVIQGNYYPVQLFPIPGTYYARQSIVINVTTPTRGADIRISIDGSEPRIVRGPSITVTLSGAGSHRIIASAVSADYSGVPMSAEYILVPEPTINVDVAAAYLASAHYIFETTHIGSVRVKLSQYGTVKVGTCDKCRVRLLPHGYSCRHHAENSSVAITLGPYATATLSRDEQQQQQNSVSENNNNEAQNSDIAVSYISHEMILSSPISRESLVVCVGGPPWYRVLPAAPRYQPRARVVGGLSSELSVIASGVGLCTREQQQMCQNGGRCSRVTFSGQHEFGCDCPYNDVKHWNSLWCNNNTNLPQNWDGTLFDVENYVGHSPSSGGGGSGSGSNTGVITTTGGSWGAFFTLTIIYGAVLAALWYHKTHRSGEEEGNNNNNNSDNSNNKKTEDIPTISVSAAAASSPARNKHSSGDDVEMK